ncbi:MAG: hypothetical protein RR540_08055, partial [Oscillospiraceae bacterium]
TQAQFSAKSANVNPAKSKPFWQKSPADFAGDFFIWEKIVGGNVHEWRTELIQEEETLGTKNFQPHTIAI